MPNDVVVELSRRTLEATVWIVAPVLAVAVAVSLVVSLVQTISLRGVEIARWEMRDDCLLAISSDTTPPPIPGTSTREPAFGVAATWIAPALQNEALAMDCAGCSVSRPT